jgi:pSer/pThr/pTyr-binding forkhead associated (FHA) protein
MPSLVVLSGPLEGKRIEIQDEMTIGREGTHVEIDDIQVSRRHAELRLVGARLVIRDLGSRNGTRVAGVRITDTVTLENGAVVSVGASHLRVEGLPSAAEETLPAPPLVGAATPAPDQPFAVREPDHRRRTRRVATRLVVPMILTYVAIAGTAAGLIAYFASR